MDIHLLQLILLTSFTIKCKLYVFPYVLIIISQKDTVLPKYIQQI